MEEDKRYYVGRITFTGNDTTRDKVIRREVYLNEGEVFNTEALKLSIRRINQLGYFKPMEGVPELKPSDLGEDKLDVIFKVEEQNRNQFTFGGGVSGLEGTFVNASFSTANFLGQGETLQLSAQSGRRTKNYQIAITEPYLFDRPITAGFDVFTRKITYETFPERGGLQPGGHGSEPRVRRCPWGGSPASSPTTRTRSSTSRASRGAFLEKDQDGDPATPEPGGSCCRRPIPTQPVLDPFFFGEAGPAAGEQAHALVRPQHRGQPLHAAQREEAVPHPAARGRDPRRDGELPEARHRGHPLHPAHPPHRARHARGGGDDHPLRIHQAAAAVPALLPGRRERRSAG